MSTRIRRAATTHDWQEAAALLHDHLDWMRARTAFDPLVEQPAFADELERVADHYRGPGAALFLAESGAVAAGVVAIRAGQDGSAELKRMYVRPVARRRGVAGRLVQAAVAAAGELGCHTVWLETVRGPMDPAIAVYRRHGFVEAPQRPPTLHLPGIVVMERQTDVARRCA